MTDVLTPEQRRRCMAAIRSRDTKPEMIVRRMAHAMGFRFRLHTRGLPGKPDLVFPRLRRVIFVHGCFWHRHRCRHGRVRPKTNSDFWDEKRGRNAERDGRNRRDLRKLGWEVLTVWECHLRDPESVAERIEAFLAAPPPGERVLARNAPPGKKSKSATARPKAGRPAPARRKSVS